MKGRTHIVWITLLATLILIAAPASAQDVVWQYDAIMPWDAERLTNNNTLITEYGNHTVIEVNTTTSEIIWQYGTAGTAGSDPGQLNSPVDAERLSGNNTLITDRNNHRVIEVNTTGAIIWQYGNGTSGSGYDQLNNPMDAERLSGGNTLIADRLNNRVIEVNESKGIVWEYVITNPFDADRLSNGNTLIVEYTNHRVIEINDSDEIVWQYGDGTSGSGVDQLNNPMDAERLANGNTLITDYINDRVIEVRTSDYDPAEPDNGFTAESIVWEHGSNHPADAERLSGGSTLICEAGGNRVIEIAYEIDLLPTAIEIPTLYDNMSNTIRATILNNGTGAASSFNVSLSVDGNPVDEVEVSGLDAGGSTVLSLFWTPSATGDFELCVTADCDLGVDESDEDNNLICGNVTVFSFEHPCYNDTFDDEAKIAGKVNVVVSGGDVELNNTTQGQGSITSVVIQPYLAYFKNWAVFNVNDTVPTDTNITYKILDASNSTIMSVVDGQDISGITQQSIRLFAELTTINPSFTPVVHDWGVCWETGEVDLIPTDIETQPFYSNLTSTIDVVIANGGDAHSGGFNAILYADDAEVDAASIDDIPAGENRTVTFEWTPVHTGDYNLSVVADSDGVIAESDEANNSLTKVVTVLSTNVRRLTFDQNSSINPNVVTDSDGNMHIVWQDYRSSTDPNRPNWEIFYKKLDASGSVLVNDTRLTYTSRSCFDGWNYVSFGASVEPAVVIDSTGNVYIAWVEQETTCLSPVFHVYFTKLDGSGNVLIAPRNLTPTSMEGYGIESSALGGIAIDPAGVIHVLWEQYTTRYGPSNVHKMYYGQFDSDGNPIGDPIFVGGLSTMGYGSIGGVRGNRYPPIAFTLDSSNNAHIVYSAPYKGISCKCGPGFGGGWYWSDHECPYPDCVHEIYYRKIDSGGTMHDVIRLTDDNRTFASLTPDVSVDADDNVHVVWVNNNVTYDPDYMSYYSGQPCMQEPGGYFDGSSRNLYHIKLDNDGETIVDGKRITFDNSTSGIVPHIDSSDEYIYITWSDCAGESDEVYYMTLGDSGETDQERFIVSLDDGVSSKDSGIAAGLYPRSAYIVWSDCRDGNDEIYYCYHRKTVMTIPANVIIEPDTLNVTEGGNFTANITLPEGYDVSDVKNSTVECEGAPALDWMIENDILTATFDTDDLRGDLPTEAIELSVTGNELDYLVDMNVTGEIDTGDTALVVMFDGSDTVRVLSTDTSPPYLAGHDPVPDATGVPADTNITVHVRDNGAGVDNETITMKVNGADVTPVITGAGHDYMLMYDPPTDFDPAEVVNVSVNASDLADPVSVMHSAYSFTIGMPDLIVYEIDAYHDDTGYPPYFNLSNEVDVTLKNIGNGDAGDFNVSLYADGEFAGRKNVSGLRIGKYATVQFEWTPVGLDCEDGGSQQTYTLKAIVDCDNDAVELNEANNELTTQEITYWAGYSADEHINAIAWHGMLHGGLHYTTGDGSYTGLYIPGNSVDIDYSITLPAGASIELARLNVYYTWSKHGSTGVYPVMEVRIDGNVVPSAAEYNDRPCGSPSIAYEYPFGNYVYDLTPYITGDGSYTVNVKNTGPSGYSFCIAAPGLVILYEDDTKPEYEFWILEGADLLEGGHRGGAGNLDLSECISNATFTGDIDTDKVDNATLGIIAPWGGVAWGADWTSYYWLNDHYLGDGSMLGGYGSLYDKTVNGMSMYAGASGNAQVGVNVSDVTSYIADHDNIVSFGDDGDSMMAANAFLALERGAGRSPAPLLIYGYANYPDGGPANDSDVVITNLNTSEVLAVETATDSNYYQAVTSSHSVSAGDVLNFNASNGNSTELNHTVTPEEMDDGCFVQNLTVGRPGICGDVDGRDGVTIGDGIQVAMSIVYGTDDYPLADPWAADVDCKDGVTIGDGIQIAMSIVYGTDDYPLGCCE